MKFQAGYRRTPAGNHAITLHIDTQGASLMFALTSDEGVDLAQRLHAAINEAHADAHAMRRAGEDSDHGQT